MSSVPTNLPHSVAGREIGNVSGGDTATSSGETVTYRRVAFQILLKHRVWLLAAGARAWYSRLRIGWHLCCGLIFEFQKFSFGDSGLRCRQFWRLSCTYSM